MPPIKRNPPSLVSRMIASCDHQMHTRRRQSHDRPVSQSVSQSLVLVQWEHSSRNNFTANGKCKRIVICIPHDDGSFPAVKHMNGLFSRLFTKASGLTLSGWFKATTNSSSQKCYGLDELSAIQRQYKSSSMHSLQLNTLMSDYNLNPVLQKEHRCNLTHPPQMYFVIQFEPV